MEKYKVQILLENIPENEYDKIISNIEDYLSDYAAHQAFYYEIGIGEPDA